MESLLQKYFEEKILVSFTVRCVILSWPDFLQILPCCFANCIVSCFIHEMWLLVWFSIDNMGFRFLFSVLYDLFWFWYAVNPRSLCKNSILHSVSTQKNSWKPLCLLGKENWANSAWNISSQLGCVLDETSLNEIINVIVYIGWVQIMSAGSSKEKLFVSNYLAGQFQIY